MTPIERREIFEKVRDHLLKQNSKCMLLGDCRYLNGDGLKCAVGCLIDDANYSKIFEDNVFTRSNPLLVAAVESSQGVTLDDTCVNMLRELQRVHDSEPVSKWTETLHNYELNAMSDETISQKEEA